MDYGLVEYEVQQQLLFQDAQVLNDLGIGILIEVQILWNFHSETAFWADGVLLDAIFLPTAPASEA
jgi:hypothetical protein